MAEKIGLIVDGDTECIAFRHQFRNQCEIRTRSSNGLSVSTDRIANEAIRIIGSLNSAGCRHKILVFDRETRGPSAKSLALEVAAKIASKVQDSFDVVVADRNFENWLLADIENICRNYKGVLKKLSNSVSHEGKNGQAVFKKLFPKGKTYDIKEVASFYRHVRRAVALQNSKSFEVLIRKASGFGLDCKLKNS